METAEAIRERVRHEQRLIERLQTASSRFADAQPERVWGIRSAHELGLSIRAIAAVTGLSSSRIHQVLNAEDAAIIPRWAKQLRATAEQDKSIAPEVKLLRPCARWLRQLENHEDVVVNLRPDSDPDTEYVRFDIDRVTRVLERIAADLDQLAVRHRMQRLRRGGRSTNVGLLNRRNRSKDFPRARNETFYEPS